MDSRADVVIVGGGIAGSALACALAAQGKDVVVLERQTEYKDRVRGETMMPWGGKEMLTLGLYDVLVDAGGGWGATMIGYDETVDPEEARANPAPLALFAEGVGGTFNVGHPQACEALTQYAQKCGARVVRGSGDVDVALGPEPAVSFDSNGHRETVRCRLVVGADGRQSIVRKALGIELEQVESKSMLGGLLVEGSGFDATADIIGTCGDVHFLVFPRPNGFARLYLAVDNDDARASGADRVDRFLGTFRDGIFPGSEDFGNCVPAGPCAFYTGTDTWTDAAIAADGAVLAGDAAGWSDPIIGQGLSIAMRDARTVADVLAGEDWSPAAFALYVSERAERMRRIRVLAHLATELRTTFTPEGRERRAAFEASFLTDPELFNIALAMLGGPELAPAETFSDEFTQRVLATA